MGLWETFGVVAIVAPTLIYMMRRINDLQRRNREIEGKFRALLRTVEDTNERMRVRIESLEKGITPDYEAAKKANDALTDFSKGISGILGFDPYIALHKDELKDE